MPLQIVHQDITTVVCDAIVNPTDPFFSGSGGTDYAIHQAAGPELEAACCKLKHLVQSEIAVTDGYRLPCRYVLHTMGPIWMGGGDNEPALLRACYINALMKASELHLQSIAFPLISSGTFGFPKDRVLKIALEAIRGFLNVLEQEPEIILCVYDRSSFELSKAPELARYLIREREETMPYSMGKTGMPVKEAVFTTYQAPVIYENTCETCDSMAMPEDLESWLKQQDDTFAVTLLKLMDEKEMDQVECYKKANVSRKTFWKIMNEAGYKPSKPTVIAFAISLRLTLAETNQLLKTVGFSLSHSNMFDMIIEFYISNGVYNIDEINSALYQYDQLCLGC